MYTLHCLVGALLTVSSLQAQQPPKPPKPPTTAERMAHIKQLLGEEMQLSDAEWKKLAPYYEQFFKKIDAAIEQTPKTEMPPPPPPPVKKEVMDKLVKERDAAVQKVLSAEQYQQYAAAVKKMHPPRPPKAPKEPLPNE